MEGKIEVELRSFISKEVYDKLLNFFNQNAKKSLEDFQETHYLNSEQDLRIQKNNYFSKIWMKGGKIHDDFREEIEIKFNKKDFEEIKKLFSKLGFSTKIIWLRDRKQFRWGDIEVSLDFTKGYGYIIELEKLSDEENKESVLQELREKFKELNIEITSKEEFNNKFNEYKENWRKLIKHGK